MTDYTENIEKASYQTLKLLPLVSSGDVGEQLILVSEDGTVFNSNQYVMQVVEDGREVESVEQYHPECTPLVLQESQNYEYISEDIQEYGQVNEAPEANDTTVADDVAVANNSTVISPFQETKEELTQLTLTEAQCRLLEEKGQVLIVHGSRSFLLNAYGLQDITDNRELILSLQSDQDSLVESNSNGSGRDSNPGPPSQQPDSLPTRPHGGRSEEGPVEQMDIDLQEPRLRQEKDGVNLTNDDNNTESEIAGNSTESKTHGSNTTVSTELQNVPSQIQFMGINKNITSQADSLVPNLKTVHKPESSRIKIKANIDLKDVPEKMFIGHSESGKKLYARAVEVKCARAPSSDGATDTPPNDVMQLNRNFEKLSSTPGKLNGSLLLLLEKHIRSKRESWTCSVEEVACARRVVRDLLRLPAARPKLLGRYLIITMMLHKVTDNSADVKMLQCMITGQVQQDETDKETWSFRYIPDIDLSGAGARGHPKEKPKKKSKEDNNKNAAESNAHDRDAAEPKGDEDEPKGDGEPNDEEAESTADNARPSSVLHLHIIETIQPPLPSNLNVVFLHRRLPIGRERGVRHACAFCAKVFFSMVTLYEHQLSCAPKSKRKPPIAAPQVNAEEPTSDARSVSDSTRCPICNLRFRRKLTYERHLLTHFGPDCHETPAADGDGAPYKCNMCPKTCLRASTLTRHIMNTHIGPNS